MRDGDPRTRLVTSWEPTGVPNAVDSKAMPAASARSDATRSLAASSTAAMPTSRPTAVIPVHLSTWPAFVVSRTTTIWVGTRARLRSATYLPL
jgi:hypothetical protein